MPSPKRAHISRSVKSAAGAISTMPAGAGGVPASARAARSAIQPPIEEPTRTGGRSTNPRITASASSSHSEIVPSSKRPCDSPWPE